ncbi:unnamed protein product [Blepharisma stoltei]|uniref:Uncharacterized protein n=1 Tax=Blepharisma stoltei TaxID=1481888 RepID=A0AAU9I6W4_9CILI|nr:unnamed protein product [Blepharisma stoltei]
MQNNFSCLRNAIIKFILVLFSLMALVLLIKLFRINNSDLEFSIKFFKDNFKKCQNFHQAVSYKIIPIFTAIYSSII